MLRVLVPYTTLHDHVLRPLREQTDRLEPVDVSGSPTAYWAMLRDAWASGEDFAIVEHDVTVAAGTIAALEECSQPWCGCSDPYWYPFTPKNSYLQCVKFAAELTKAWPDFITAMPTYARHWLALDAMVLPRLEARGYVEHHHDDFPTFHPHGHQPAERARRTMDQIRWLAPLGAEARQALADWHARRGQMGPVEKADADVFSRRAAVASMLLDQGVEDASDEEILARCGFRMPVA